jgi:protein phosphatase PTC2/3
VRRSYHTTRTGTTMSDASSSRKRSSTPSSDEKSQTFRKRRLSLSNLTAAAVATSTSPAVASGPSERKDVAPRPATDGTRAVAAAAADGDYSTEKILGRLNVDSGSQVNLSAGASHRSFSEAGGDASGASSWGKSEATASGSTAGAPTGDVSDDGVGKAQTFRKRRLSLTHRLASEDSVSVTNASSIPGIADGEYDSSTNDVYHPNAAGPTDRGPECNLHQQQQQQQHLRSSLSAMSRRLSEASTGSLASSSSWQQGPPTGVAATGRSPRLPCTIMHASELLESNGGPPPSPALHNDSVLYREMGPAESQPLLDSSLTTHHQPPPHPAFFQLPPAVASLSDSPRDPTGVEDATGGASPGHASENRMAGPAEPDALSNPRPTPAAVATIQPRWKRRHVLTDEDKLPFPKHVVGMYSCHGMEPVYDDDDNEDNVFDDEMDPGGDDDEDDENVLSIDGWNFPPPPPLSTTVTTAMDGGVMQLQFTPVRTWPGQTLPEKESTPIRSAPPFTPESPTPYPVSHLLQVQDGQQIAQMTFGAQTPVRPIAPVKSTSTAKINQDRGGVAYPYGNCPRTALFAVYDGHGQGGELVSQFALSEIQRRLVRHPDFPSPKSFVETFVKVDEALRHEPLIDPNFAGTTACVVLMKNDELVVGNVGDSRAVVARRTGSPRAIEGNQSHGFSAIPLTEDQNPDFPGELERISMAGGYVTASPSPGLSARVWLDASCTQIGLAMSRSIGDHSVSAIGVIAEPVVINYQVDGNDEFLILASDGVWEFLDSQDAVDVVARNLQDRDDASKACQALIEAAAKRWHEEEGEYRDDITAIVVRLQHVWKEPVATSPNPARG